MIEHLFSSISAFILIILNISFSYLLSKRFVFINSFKINFLILHTFFYFIIAQIIFVLLIAGVNIKDIKIFFYILYFLILTNLVLQFKDIKKIFISFFKNKNYNFLIYFFIFLFLLLFLISPVSDADSLDYHIGGPIDILREGYFKNRGDHWFHFRLMGSGEMINLYGLIFNSKNFGQIFQIIPIIHIMVVLNLVFKKNIKLTILLLFSSPIILHLSLSAKHILFLTSIYLLIFYIIKFLSKELSKNKNLLYVLIFFNFIPIAFKYSYLIYSLPIFIYIMFSQQKILRHKNLIQSLIFTGLLICPIFIKNIIFYTDPISPFFEFLKSNPENIIMSFANELRFSEKIFNLKEFLIIPFLHVNPFSNSPTLLLSPVILIFYLYLIRYENWSSKILIFSIYLLLFMSGKSQSRYYLDLYLITIILSSELIIKIYSKKISGLLIKILSLSYLFLSAIIVLFGIYFLTIPSFKGQKNFDDMMSKNANNYEIVMFLNQNIGINEIIIHDQSIRSKSFQKYNFYYYNFENLNLIEIQNIIKNKNPSKIVINQNIWLKIRQINSCNENDVKSKFMNRSTRNPYNRIKNIDKIFIVDTRCLIL